MKKNLGYFAIASLLFAVACTKNIQPPVAPTRPPVDTLQPVVPVPEVWNDNDNMLLGNPNKAAAIADSANNYLMRKSYYAESYSRDRGTPNWVSWHLFQADEGTTDRQDDFRADNTIPTSWYHVQDFAYSGSGFDRGHNCPSGDRTSSTGANSATFLMTNMIPQAPYNNQVTWSNMESYIRSQVNTGLEAYIIMGSYGTGGTGDKGYATTIDSGHVTVPARIWKVVVLMPNGNNDTTRIKAGTRVIAVDIPNSKSVNKDWKTYRTSVDVIEKSTGYDLLSRLPVPVQSTIEAVVDAL